MFTQIFDSVWSEPSLAPITTAIDSFIASSKAYLPYILMALCLIVGLFGRRLSGLIRVVLLFLVGFIAGVYWCAPVIQKVVPNFTALLIGLLFGILAAVLSFLIYNIAYATCIGYDVYNICFSGLYLVEVTAFTKGNLEVSLAIAAITVIVAFVLRKYLEMILTAGIGGVGIAFLVKGVYDYTAFVALDANTTAIIAGAVLAVIMFVIQFRNRLRY